MFALFRWVVAYCLSWSVLILIVIILINDWKNNISWSTPSGGHSRPTPNRIQRSRHRTNGSSRRTGQRIRAVQLSGRSLNPRQQVPIMQSAPTSQRRNRLRLGGLQMAHSPRLSSGWMSCRSSWLRACGRDQRGTNSSNFQEICDWEGGAFRGGWVGGAWIPQPGRPRADRHGVRQFESARTWPQGTNRCRQCLPSWTLPSKIPITQSAASCRGE